MLKLEKTEVVGWEAAIRGMRNPMNSWDQSDSAIVNDGGLENSDIIVEKKVMNILSLERKIKNSQQAFAMLVQTIGSSCG